jgi:hypothetical protein
MAWLLVVFSGCLVFGFCFCVLCFSNPRFLGVKAIFGNIVEKGKPGAVLEKSCKPVVKRKDQAPMYLA